jgi:glycerol-3-phosphate acyltransferase PlsY
LLVLFGYLFGAVPVGVLVGRVWGFDPRTVGSGNIGATNVARAGGKIPALITFGADVLKGFIPIQLGKLVVGSVPPVLALVGFATFVGAVASIFLKFHGGRGVAASVGVWLGLAPTPVAIALGVFAAVLLASRIVSLASVSAALALPPATAGLAEPRPYILLAIIMAALVTFRHKENIARLVHGQEPTIGTPKFSRAAR